MSRGSRVTPLLLLLLKETIPMSRTRTIWTRDTARHVVRHYLEMVAAMNVGMVALGPCGPSPSTPPGHPRCSTGPNSTPCSWRPT
jgi:hypothetical protein